MYKDFLVNLLESIKGRVTFLERTRPDHEFIENDPSGQDKVYKKNAGHSVSISRNKSGGKIIIKKSGPSARNSFYRHLQYEAEFFRVLNTFQKNRKNIDVYVPKIYSLSKRDNNLKMIIQFIEGRTLKETDEEQKLFFLEKCLIHMRRASKILNKNDLKTLPTREMPFFVLPFPIYVFFVAAKLRDIKLLNLLPLFYRNYLMSKSANSLCIAHRDLHSDNVLLKRGNIYMIDFEIAVLSDEETDVAIIPILYHQEISFNKIMLLVKKFTKNNNQARRIYALTVFYMVQLLALQKRDSRYFNNAYRFLKIFTKVVTPNFNRLFSEFKDEPSRLVITE